jgi:antitoxin CptB
VAAQRDWRPVMSELDRLRWRCRRGLLELDIILAHFLDTGLADLGPEDRQTFTELLALADNDLWDLISRRQTAPEAAQERVLELLRHVQVPSVPN